MLVWILHLWDITSNPRGCIGKTPSKMYLRILRIQEFLNFLIQVYSNTVCTRNLTQAQVDSDYFNPLICQSVRPEPQLVSLLPSQRTSQRTSRKTLMSTPVMYRKRKRWSNVFNLLIDKKKPPIKLIKQLFVTFK